MLTLNKSLAILSLLGLANSAVAKPPETTKEFSLSGIRPGQNYRLSQKLLGVGWTSKEVDRNGRSRQLFLQDKSGRHLMIGLTSQGKSEVMDYVTYFPVNRSFSLEVGGIPYLKGVESEEAVRRKFHLEKVVGSKAVVSRGEQRLTLRFNLGRGVLESATLSLAK